MRGLVVSIESTYLACLAYAVRGRTNALRGGYWPAARPRSLEGTLVESGGGYRSCEMERESERDC